MAASPRASAASFDDYLDRLTNLNPGLSSGVTGRIAFAVERCLYVAESGIEELARAPGMSSQEGISIVPPKGFCYVIVELSVKNLHLEPFIVADALDFKLEDAGGNLPGWDVCTEAQDALSSRPTSALDPRPGKPGGSRTPWIDACRFPNPKPTNL